MNKGKIVQIIGPVVDVEFANLRAAFRWAVDREDLITAAALEEKAKLRKHFTQFDIFFFLICTLVGVDTIGDLYIRGPTAAVMYWDNRERTRATFQGEWTKSGDKYLRNSDGSVAADHPSQWPLLPTLSHRLATQVHTQTLNAPWPASSRLAATFWVSSPESWIQR
mgnify:CR=1 FL=1